MRPLVGLRNLVSRLKQVVFPAPFGPISAWMVPRATQRFTSRTATKPANSLVRPSVSRTMSLAIENAPNSAAAPLCRKLSGKGPGAGRHGAGRPLQVTKAVRAPVLRATALGGAARPQQHKHGGGEVQDEAKHQRRRVTARGFAHEADQTRTQRADHAADAGREAQHRAESGRREFAMND